MLGGAEFSFKGNPIGQITRGSSTTMFESKLQGVLAKQTKVTFTIDDVIAITKVGYLDYRCVITTSDTNGIVSKLLFNAGNLTDADGNVYQSIKIGDQIWTTENLRTTKYNDSSAIPLDTSTTTWRNATTPKYCYYGNITNADSIKRYGALYNWYAFDSVNTGKIAPAGWHVPSDSEWTVLENFLILNGYRYDGATSSYWISTGEGIAKALASKAGWKTVTDLGAIGTDLTKNNASGFSALPGGFRYEYGTFYSKGDWGYWWSASGYNASQAYDRYLMGYRSYRLRNVAYKSCGYSVRLVKD